MVQSNGNNALSDALVRHVARANIRAYAPRGQLNSRSESSLQSTGLDVSGFPSMGVLQQLDGYWKIVCMKMMKKCMIKMGTPILGNI